MKGDKTLKEKVGLGTCERMLTHGHSVGIYSQLNFLKYDKQFPEYFCVI